MSAAVGSAPARGATRSPLRYREGLLALMPVPVVIAFWVPRPVR
ncbi:hypothetical protein ACFV30_33945 [Streptomyces sp. NPDC059752]